MQNFYKFFFFLLLIGTVLFLEGCGKIAAPLPYEGSDYPHSYPRN